MRSFNPLVSIVIPVYNGSNYVSEAIDSALAQTYKNIEIVVVNDGSTDNTEEIVKSYGNKVRYFKKQNGGVSTALNLGIKKMKGEYFSWLSHDDLYYPEKIEKQVKELERVDSKDRDKTILMSNFALIDKHGKIISITGIENIYNLKNGFDSLYPVLTAIVNGCTLLIPKKCFDKFGYFDPKLRLTQDYDLWFRMFPKNKIVFMKDVLTKMRVHNKQDTWKIKDNSEYNVFWIRVMESLDNSQKEKIFGNLSEFYLNMYNMASESGYLEARNYLQKKISDYEKKIGEKINISQKPFVTKKEKYYLDRIYARSIFGQLLTRFYLKIKKIMLN